MKTHMTRLPLTLLLLTTACTTTAPHTRPPSPAALDPAWAPFAFLLGEWRGVESPTAPGVHAEFSLQPELDGKVLVRHNLNESPQGRHEDLLVLYREGTGPRAFYVDNENHVIHYAVTSGDKLVTLTSDEVPGRPRFRLTYRQKEDSRLDITFALQPPGAPDFQTYLQGEAVRR
jgi:hypothetical protein